MVAHFFIALLSSLQLWLAGVGPVSVPGRPSARPASRVAQVADAGTTATPAAADRAAASVAALLGKQRRLAGEKSKLTAQHRKQLAEVDRLKRRRASWRRDRQLGKALATSQQLAASLSAKQQQLRGVAASLRRQRIRLRAAARRELAAGGKAPRRQQQLRAWLRSASRALAAQSAQKRIRMPDDRIDPLSDPEDLDYQAARIAQSEKQLERELASLLARAKRYDRMVNLRRKANRAAEISRFDDDRPRRSTGRVAGAGNRDSAEPSADSGGNGAGAAPGDGEGAGTADPAPQVESDPVVVLADVVDASTLADLRRAQSSGDARVKSRAAKRARKQVEGQLERLRRVRRQIERRARSLRHK